ncbi:hypothetical protein AOC36_04555 [Erysipelothrix larvae]|uniref:ABC transporter domain-containing protein n=1 Tax=Erysipelothrix larvae TaxID=1514105 RepID=A0A0X8GZG5_9FIRM|nr:metal ABC transporter ATP-binding protein [Erysipelothrix larvae]AMC93267.1 hypothetical protein AOC36_04555 [Erysipelothrix larvae]
MNQIIQFNDVHFAYGKQEVLCGLKLDVIDHDFMAIVGANGSGKSTLLKIILGFLKPQEGNVSVNAKTLGYVPQGGLLNVSSFPANALEIVMLRLKGDSFVSSLSKKRKERALEALKKVGMEDAAYKLISTLSGGQLQRVLIAREIGANPDLLILDEPTNGLDEASVKGLFELLQKLNQELGVSILVVNHDLEEIKPYVNRLIRVENKHCHEVTL